jgi:drug/metabolite transporter (DMT)-like permease
MFAGVLLALLTSLSWAGGNVFVQKSGRAVGTVRATGWALLIGALVAGTLSFFLDHPRLPVTGAVVGWTLLSSVAGLTAYVCLFYTFSHGELSLTAPIITSWSLIASVLSMVLFGERLGPVPLTGAALVFSGVTMVAVGSSRASAQGPHPGRRLLVALGAALGFGVMIPALTHVTPALGELRATSIVYLTEVALGLPIALLRGASIAPPPRAAWPLVMATALTETAGFVAVSFARRFAPLAVVTPVSSLASALTLVYAWLVLRERPRPLAAAGAAIASTGIVVLAM